MKETYEEIKKEFICFLEKKPTKFEIIHFIHSKKGIIPDYQLNWLMVEYKNQQPKPIVE